MKVVSLDVVVVDLRLITLTYRVIPQLFSYAIIYFWISVVTTGFTALVQMNRFNKLPKLTRTVMNTRLSMHSFLQNDLPEWSPFQQFDENEFHYGCSARGSLVINNSVGSLINNSNL